MDADGQAVRCGLKIDDQIHAVNGRSFTDIRVTEAEKDELLELWQPGVTVVVKRRADSVLAADSMPSLGLKPQRQPTNELSKVELPGDAPDDGTAPAPAGADLLGHFVSFANTKLDVLGFSVDDGWKVSETDAKCSVLEIGDELVALDDVALSAMGAEKVDKLLESDRVFKKVMFKKAHAGEGGMHVARGGSHHGRSSGSAIAELHVAGVLRDLGFAMDETDTVLEVDTPSIANTAGLKVGFVGRRWPILRAGDVRNSQFCAGFL